MGFNSAFKELNLSRKRPKRPENPWSPPNHLFSGYWRSFPW